MKEKMGGVKGQPLACLVFQLLISGGVTGFPKRIPIGAMFDSDSLQAHTAFRYEIGKHNNSTAYIFKLDNIEKIINISDSYELTQAMCSTMAKGVFALYGVTNHTSLATIQSYGDTFHMPYVTPSVAYNQLLYSNQSLGPSPGFTLQIRPLYSQAIVDVIRHYKWRKIYYLYDADEGLNRIQRIFQVISTEGYKVELDVVRIHNVEHCYATLRDMDGRQKTGDKFIVLDMSSEENLQSLLRQIQNVGMNRASYHYLLGTLVMDELDLTDFKHGGVNITGFRLLRPENPRVLTIRREWAKLNSAYWRGAGQENSLKLDAALTMDAVKVIVEGLNSMLKEDPDVFRNTFRRGQVYNNGTRGIECTTDPAVPWKHGPAIMQSFTQVSVDGITGPVAFDQYGYRTKYKLDVLKMVLDTDIMQIGSWDTEIGILIDNDYDGFRESRQQTPANKTRIVTSLMTNPFLMKRVETPEDGTPLVGNDRYEGFCADLASKIADLVNFDYILKEVEDGIYGARKDDGTWNGMVGELTRGEADLAIAPLTITSVRERVIDFSKPFMSLGISIMIKKPEKQKPGVFSFMDPLDKDIWMCIVFSYVGVSIVLFLVSRFSPYEWQIEDSVNGPTFTNDFTILNSLWFSLGAFMQQGCDISPRSLSGRIVGSAWWFFTLIIISSYTANLAAFLTVERMLTPIESADDLAKQDEIQYGTLDDGSTKDFFKHSKINVYEKMWKFMQHAEPSVFVKSTKAGVQRVRSSKGKYAFLLESTMNEYYNQRKPCNTMKVGDNLDSKHYGIATPLNSDLREQINLAVLQLRETGFLQKLQKKWWYDKGECAAETEGKGSTQSALTLSNVAGIFYILIGGLGLSMVVSLLEFLWKSRLETRRQRALASTYRSKTRLSTRSTPERENGGVGSPDLPKSMSTVPIARSSAVSLV